MAHQFDGELAAATAAGKGVVARLLEALVVSPEDWQALPAAERQELAGLSQLEPALVRLVARHLLTPFQADSIRAGAGDDLVLGHYRILDLIGRGGMGAVYRAEHVYLRRQVAVKVIIGELAENPYVLDRFTAEARAVARLRHPNIVACLDAGRDGRHDRPVNYFVMEYVPGHDLDALVRGHGPLRPARACELFLQVTEALGEAHRHGLVHRDIKPSNVIVTPDGQAKVLDFGLARIPHQHMTEPGTLLGTIGYMAPEQARDPHAVDTRADLWSVGATLYWALTGREPYPETGDTVADLHRRFTTTPPPVRAVVPEVPAALSDLVTRLMQTDPEARHPSARAVAASLAAFAHAPPAGQVRWAAPTHNTVLPAAPTRAQARRPEADSAAVLSVTASRLLAEVGVTGAGHADRVSRYVRALAAAVADRGEYARLKDAAFTDLLAAVAPVYDIGMLAVPRAVLMKPDRLDADELAVLQSHTTLGGDVLEAVAGQFGDDDPALHTAHEVARGHHERWDGTGYPDHVAGADIPLAARVVAVASVYEALRSRRPHRPALSHARAVRLMTENSPGHFDPVLLAAFAAAAPRFDQIRQGTCPVAVAASV